MAKFDLKGMLSERSAQEIDLPEQKTVYRNPEDLIREAYLGRRQDDF